MVRTDCRYPPTDVQAIAEVLLRASVLAVGWAESSRPTAPPKRTQRAPDTKGVPPCALCFRD
jgi:hypothetical protein